jgi:RND superfamily putative drug exporter
MQRNIAERAARWSASHWKTATFGWLAFVAVAVIAGQAAGVVKLSDTENSNGEPARAERALEGAGFHRRASESVLVRSARMTAGDPAFRGELRRVEAAVRALPQATDIRTPLTGHPDQVSADRHAAIVQFDMRGAAETASSRVKPALAAVAALERAAPPGVTVTEFGDASAQRELDETTGKDFSRAETLTLPVTFLVLLLAFGAFVAAGIPVLLAFSAVLASLGLAALASHLLHASSATSSVMLLIGMAVGVDYSLFYLKREREERRGSEPDEALARAAATSGRAVLISGTTVLIAMAGTLMAGSKIFSSFGVGAMIVVAVTMIGSLTVLPALLGKLSDRVDRGILAVLSATVLRVLRLPGLRAIGQPRLLVRLRERRTLLARLKGDREGSRAWALALRPALRHPAAAVLITTAALLVLALPTLSMHTRLMGFGDLPRQLKIVQSYEEIQQAFPGAQSPAVVAVQAPDVQTPLMRNALARLKELAAASPRLRGPVNVQISPHRDLAQVEVPLAGNGDEGRSFAALRELRERVLPASIGSVPGASYAVTGETPGTQQFTAVTKRHWPLVFAFVLGLAFLLLLVTFRSLVIPLTAIALNLLSVGAAYGVLVWIFQDGHLQGLLGFHSAGAIVTWLPLFLFAVLFGLSMDYHVFVVSRIKELADRGASTEEAVERGIAGTAGTVTAAAAVMVAVFAVFATLSTLEIKQMGVGLAVAVLIDATVIRAVLLPATMKLLGRWNWYLPRWLQWLPHIRAERPAGRPLPEAG